MGVKITGELLAAVLLIIFGLIMFFVLPHMLIDGGSDVNPLKYEIESGNLDSTKSGYVYYDSAYLDGNSSYAKIELELENMGDRDNVTFIIQSVFTDIMDIDNYGVLFGQSTVKTKSTDMTQNEITFKEEGKKTIRLNESNGKYPRVAYRILEPEEIHDDESYNFLIKTFVRLLGIIYVIGGFVGYFKE